MKDTTIAYDLVHQPQASWNQQRQQHQTHTTSVYANHTTQQQLQQPNAQRSPISHQQQNQHAAQLGQYQHQQQLQSSAHHNTAAVAAAYYQQAHMYPTYQTHAHSQEQQQHPTGSEHQQQQQQHHHHGSSVNVTGATSPAIDAAVVAAAQQQHNAVHHPQSANTQPSALNHAGWSPGVNNLTPQAHHAVVTDHSTLAYMSHAYQSHNSSVGDHHRNSNAPMSNQPIGTGPQASSYAVDSLYNTSAAAAAVAAYGYNNYNTAFFQSSNNSPHSQAGHPTSASLSGFWGHSQSQPQRNHSQSISNQASLQQRQQQLAPEQTTSYMHDPRLYYGRPAYGQNLQNFGQHHSQTQPQTDIVHHRLSTISQQPPLVPHHEQHLSQGSHQQNQHLHNPSPLMNQQSQYNQTAQHQTESTESQQSSDLHVSTVGQQSRKIQSIGTSAQPSLKKVTNETEIATSHNAKNSLDHDQVTSTNQLSHGSLLNNKAHQIHNAPNSGNVGTLSSGVTQSESREIEAQQLQPTPLVDNKSQVAASDNSSGQYQLRKSSSNTVSQPSGRNNFRSPQDDRTKSHLNEPLKKTYEEKEQRHASKEPVEKAQAPPPTHHEPDLHNPTLEDSMATLTISARKTTWASIASQPAKVSQPKSLKSKISGSNSVLSSAKHLASSSIDSSSLESKNGINPAIKSSVSSAATSIQKSSVPPPITKTTASATATLKFDILGENADTTKISWPAVNAAANLRLNEPLIQKDDPPIDSHQDQHTNDRLKRDDAFKNRDYKDPAFRDHNHNQGSKIVNNYQGSHGRRDEFWYRRENPRDHQRIRRDSDRKESEYDKKLPVDQHNEQRDQSNTRRDVKIINSRPNFRGDDLSYRDYPKHRGAMMDRSERGNDSYHNARFSQNRYEPPRDHQQGNRQNSNENAPHHHYNNVRDGNHSRNPPTKPDLNVHPHLNPANFNPKVFDLEPENARFFIIKSYSEDDIHRSIKYSIWCSTNHGNRRLDEAYKQQQAKNGRLYLFFSVNGSGHFCGMAQMTSAVDFDSSSGVWAQSKWQGEFSVKWIYVKDVPNGALRHITLENNEDKPVTNSRDTQEVPSEKGKAVLKILHQYNHSTSIFDDFLHYERRQEEEKMKKSSHQEHLPAARTEDNRAGSRFNNRPYVNARSHNEFHGNRDRPSRFAS